MENKNLIKNIDYSKIVDARVNMSFYKELTYKIISYIQNNNSATFQEIICRVGGGERRVIRLLDQMIKLGLLAFDAPNFILPERTTHSSIQSSDVHCPHCDSKMVKIDGKMLEILDFIKKIQKERPESTFIFDQRPVNPETVIRRVAYAIWRGDIQDKKIVIIGDDDFTSLAIAKTKMAKEVVVFEIDERILNTISTVSEKYNLGIKTVKQDLLKQFSKKYISQFDTFITDPTPTLKPLLLFTTRGLQLLKKMNGKVGYIYLYPSHTSMTVDFQKSLSEKNILITDIIPFFNQYEIIKHTLSEHDLELFDKYHVTGNVSFYEYLMRIETCDDTIINEIEISLYDILGKATLEVLQDPKKDPTLSKNNSDYIEKSAQILRRKIKKHDK